MEADVAIHTPEKWSAGEACFDQPEKVKFIYSGRLRGEKDTVRTTRQRGKAPHNMKPSKSYDNELEASVATDVHQMSVPVVRSGAQKVKDDLGLSNQRKRGHPEGEGHSKPAQAPSTAAGFRADLSETWERSRLTRDHDQTGVNKREKQVLKDKPPTRKMQTRTPGRNENTSNFEELSITEYGEFYYRADNPHFESERLIPLEFHQQKDQTEMFNKIGPKTIRQRPSTLTPSSPTSSLREKGTSMLILEVKDGPTFFYKPSSRMASDTEEGTRIASHMSYDSSFASMPMGITQTAESPVPVRSIHYSSISPRGSPLIGASLSKGSPSLLPRALGLRRPDLSVLKKSSKSSTERLDTSNDSLDAPILVGPSLANTETNKEPILVSPSPAIQQQSPTVPSVGLLSNKVRVYESWQEPVLTSGVMAPAPEVPTPEVLIPNQGPVSVKPESVGFLNTSEILQQKAGIKHDDIVVGPRRPNSILLSEIQPDFGFSNSGDAVKYDSFLGSETKSAVPRQSLPVKVGCALSGIPALQKRSIVGERSGHWDPIVFSEQHVTVGDFKSDVKAVRSQEMLGVKDTKTKRARGAESGPPSSAESSLERKTPVGGSLDRARWRPKESKSGVRQPNSRVKKADNISTDFGYVSADKTKLASPEVNLRNYSEQRKLSKLSVETKLTTKAASSARQLQSPGAARHKTKPGGSTPAKKQQPIPPRLNMLSNIPVPMSHDPPLRKTSQLPQKAQPKTQTPESGNSPPESFHVACHSDGHSVRSFHALSEPSPNTLASVQASELNQTQLLRSETPPEPGTRSLDTCTASAGALSRKKIPVLQKKPNQAALSSDKSSSNNNENSYHDAFNTGESWKNKENLRLEPRVNTEVVGKTLVDSSAQVPAKPRLHRSAEHLFGDAKLTVFNSSDNIQHFDDATDGGGGAASKSFQCSVNVDNKMAVDSIGPLRKDRGLARIGILRRGSDRTEMCRRGLDRGVPINDPSVEDLKKATSLKELCQSVASLLNIDNEKAAEMITSSLSQRQDLVEGLDADAILDYLSHHGVLDPAILVGLDKGSNPKQRNSTIIKHVEEHGTTAVALFINALRQSGQLHLASSLDTEQRIKPVSGDGYFGKDRHKGEVTVRVEMEALKILAPREPRTDKIVDASLLSSPTHHTGTTPNDTGGPLVKDDLEDDKVKPRSCWCFCFSRKSKVKRASSLPKRESDKKKKMDAALREGEAPRYTPGETPHRTASHEEVDRKNPNVKPHRTKSKEKPKKAKDGGTKVASSETSTQPAEPVKHQMKENAKKSKVTKPKTKSSGKYAVPDSKTSQPSGGLDSVPDVQFKTGRDEVFFQGSAGGDGADPSHTRNGVSPPTSLGSSAKDGWDPIIMEYDPQLELVKLRAGQEELASPTRQYGQVGIMCEQWKSNGRHYLQKASLLCGKIIEELHTEIIKYFEQDRGTLVLDVVSDGSAILIFNICMLKTQVRRLQKEVDDGSLITKMEDMFFSKVDISTFDIRGVKLKIVLDDQQANTALLELS
ncbi:unnamed protein product [Lymnaea stagnalis]|uniref:CARD domain-containing protein n=1 Tax=Lymnaea stagnalis TaxID=6523 RepID=A0AAV2H268_LYMST